MKLSNNMANAVKSKLESMGDIRAFVKEGRSKGMSDVAIMWGAWFCIPNKVSNEMLAQDGHSFIGGYVQGVNDAHIETMLKRVFKEYLA